MEDLCLAQKQPDGSGRIQIYEDTGRGFQEEQSCFLEEDAEEQVWTDEEGITHL